jgi:hypothetical protein
MQLQVVKQTKVTQRRLTRTELSEQNANVEECGKVTVLAVEFFGARQLVLGTDDGMSKATVAPDSH